MADEHGGLVGSVRVGKAAGRRRRRRTDDPRTVRVTVRLSPDEYERVATNAAAARLAVAAYLARVGCQPPVAPETVDAGVDVELLRELMGVHRQLRGAAGNLNQAVAARHATGTEPGALPAAAGYVRRVAGAVDDLVADLAARVRRR